ncbi:MAG: hypothetical protein HOM34_03720 [Planctomycetes bacterium]|jgi:hypothetical protein|nr:hypothetical protein [Planctomycetota bacterium]MBT4028041.1 hypothetical protein [Planctomycetota bacterium]MBT4561069.1 hypothetical protein [Planctomycetota bacterium]MBT5100629.1 hypothetical protein [Planctomycetota bacterium]MBT5119813.1 hypothetical protein [Planctomycetota bacterium]
MNHSPKTRPLSAFFAGVIFLFACVLIVQAWEVAPKVEQESAQIAQ